MKFLSLLTFAAVLAGCAAAPNLESGLGASRWAVLDAPGEGGARGWEHRTLPGKAPTQFIAGLQDGRQVIAAEADKAASLLRQQVRIESNALGTLRFSWRVPVLIDQADLALRHADDAPVRIVLAFEGDRSRFSPRDALLSELARSLTGEELPYATLMYVWCNQRPAGTVIKGPRTDRIRKLVVESGAQRLDRWLEYERDVRADYERAFGEPPGALVGVAIMTDSDNTRSKVRAWYGRVQLTVQRTAR